MSLQTAKISDQASVSDARSIAATLPPATAVELADSAGPLSAYFRELSHTETMTREQELVLATRIRDLRRNLWRAVLNYPPFIAGICALACAVARSASTHTTTRSLGMCR